MKQYPLYLIMRFSVLLLLLITGHIKSFSQSANNACGSAVTLTSGITCSATTGNLQNATKDGPNSACSHTTLNDVWFKFTAQSATTTITVNNLGANLSAATTYAEVLSGTCGSFTSVLCQSVTSNLVTSTLTVGQVYYVRVYITGSTSGNPASKWNFDICVTNPPPVPVNDNCASATSLVSNSSCSNTAGTVAGSTNSGVVVSSCGGTADDDVWYKFTAVQPITTISLSSIGSSLSSSGTVVELFSGSCGSLTSIGCASGTSSTLSLSTALTVGSTYYIRVYSSGNSAIITGGDFNICVTHASPPANDNCSGAISLTASTGCSNTAGTILAATNSGVAVSSCGGTADDDVWYSFTAINGPLTTISLSSLGSSLTGNTTIELFSGTCGSLTSIACATGTSVSSSLTAGNVYYVRVYSTGSSVITSNGTFNICVSTPAPPTPALVSTGKSFINISRPGGGTIVPGDVLEIRVSVNVSNAGSNLIFRSRFNDTIPSNLTYVPGSLKLLTNEGKQYAAYTDAAGDDAAMYDGSNKTIRFNLGRDTANMSRGNVSNTGIDSLGGGYTNSNTHRPRANGMLVIVTYRVTVNAAVPYNTIINFGSGAIRYRNQLSATGAVDYLLAPNSLSFIVYPNYGLCSNATGANYVSAGNGNFGSGTAQNGPSPGAAVPGYGFLNITTNAPNDGNYSVVKNLSPSQSTDPTIARPESTATNRVFSVWDIIGDHTNAADPLAGNPAPASGVTGGYMLAVNAAYQLSVANNQTISGLCEDTYYEFSAWFRNVCKRCGADSLGNYASNVSVPVGYIPTAPGDSSGVKPNLTFMINGVDYYNTGDMDYVGTWGQWVKKGFVFKTGTGQTSLTISIKNNAPGGGGNDWVMDDISFATCLPALTMRPTNNPTYCANGQVDISVAVSTYFDNYTFYEWERSTDGGSTWTSAPELPGMQTFGFTNYSGEYRDTAVLPSFIAASAYNGYKYRIRVATTSSNLTSGSCAVYNDVDIITLNVNDISSGCTILNLDLKDFKTTMVNGKAKLVWNAIAEKGNYYFEIERSTDGTSFTNIARIEGNGTSWNTYSFTDPESVANRTFYRVRLVTEAGIQKLSNISVISVPGKDDFIVSALVNPFSSQVRFDLHAPASEKVKVQLVDIMGQIVYNSAKQVNTGYNNMVLEYLPEVKPGTYVLRIYTSRGVINKRIEKR